MKAIALLLCSLFLFYGCKTGTKKPAAFKDIPLLPPNWQHVDSSDAVILGKKQYNRNGIPSNDYAVIVNLAAGGGINILDSIYSADSCSPVFNTYSVTESSSRSSFWFLFSTSKSFAMANLQFFNFTGNQVDTAQVCYPVFYNGKYTSQGCVAGSCKRDQKFLKRILIITDTISIQDYPFSTPCNNYTLPANTINAVVGNNPLTNRDSSGSVARTYIAKQGSNLVLYTSEHAKDVDIYTVLQNEFNVAAAHIIMFDGGGSTQMVCNGVTYISSSSNRWVPSAIEIYSAGKNGAIRKQ